MRGTFFKAIVALGLLGLAIAGAAQALKIEIGKTVVSATATVEPRALPAKANAPVSVSSVTRIGTTDGSTPSTLKELVFQFDRNGAVETKGLPTCTMAKLAETTVQEARKRCAGAIVGEGTGKAVVTLPGGGPQRISSPLTLFNAPPQGGQPSLIVHAYETVPAPKAVLVPFTVERIHKGRYGYQVKIPVPPIAAGFGSATLAEATIGKTWKRGGKTVGYANARCSGGRLQVRGTISFTDGGFFPGTLTSPCHVSG
ncbi:MAG: hypothetical protein ABW065_08530 [Solirubrobacterales bacterium]